LKPLSAGLEEGVVARVFLSCPTLLFQKNS
jgi:hypothetical protein